MTGIRWAALAAFFMLTSPALAQSNCGPHDRLLANAKDRYGERPVSAGVTARGWLVEVLASEDGATWTIIVTSSEAMADQGGFSCVTASGRGWKTGRFKPQEEGS